MIGQIKPRDGQVNPHEMHSRCLIVLDAYVHTCSLHAHAYMHIYIGRVHMHVYIRCIYEQVIRGKCTFMNVLFVNNDLLFYCTECLLIWVIRRVFCRRCWLTAVLRFVANLKRIHMFREMHIYTPLCLDSYRKSWKREARKRRRWERKRKMEKKRKRSKME